MALADTDILKATDAELRVLAAKAMGIERKRSEGQLGFSYTYWRNGECVPSPKPTTRISEAIELSEHLTLNWQLHRTSRGFSAKAWRLGQMYQRIRAVPSDSPARALTRAALLALQAAS